MCNFYFIHPTRAEQVPLCPVTSNVDLFRYRKGIVDLDPEVADGALDPRGLPVRR